MDEQNLSGGQPEPQSAAWPPPPTNGPTIAEPDYLRIQEINSLVIRTRVCFWLGFLFCGLVHMGTIYFGRQANQLAGRGVATSYIVVGTILLSITLLCLIYAFMTNPYFFGLD